MKINNKNVVRFLFAFYLILLSISALALLGLGFLFPEIFRKIRYVGLAFATYNIFKIFRLTYFEYENSGEVLSLRSYNIFRKKYEGRQIEMPLEKIRKLQVKKTFWINYLIINIQKDDRKVIKIHFPIDHIKKRDLLKIEKNFLISCNMTTNSVKDYRKKLNEER